MSRLQHIDALDGLRGIAAWLVVLSHINNTLPERFVFLSGAGSSGVMIFFVLSGFLMGYLYAGSAPNRSNYADFAVARIARVLPLYLIVVIISFLIKENARSLLPYIHVYDVTSENVMEHLLFIKGTNVLWTIPIEVTFYALFAGLWLVRGSSTGLYLIVIGTLWLLANGTSYHPLPNGNELPIYVTYFFGGLIVAEIYRIVPPMRDRYVSVSGLAFVSIGIFLLIPGNYRSVFGTALGGWNGPAAPILAIGICGAACYSTAAQRVLGLNFLRLQGAISYSVYLIHPIVLHTLRKTTALEGLILFPTGVGVTFGVALLSYRFIEQPMRRYVRSLRTGAMNRPGFAGGSNS